MLIIGITGGTGCGKTTLVNKVLEKLPKDKVGVISQDSYYKDTTNLSSSERIKINFDHPDSIDFDLLITQLKSLKNNISVEQPVYSFIKHNRTNDTVLINPKSVIIVEGILVFSIPELRNLFDIKIFIDTDSDERLIRRLKRDISERGRDLNEVLSRYKSTLKPMHNQFIEPMKIFADIIIPNNTSNNSAVKIMRTIINENL